MQAGWIDRVRGALLLAVAGFAGVAGAGTPASQQPLPAPDLPITTTGWVYALARQSDGAVIVGGDFIQVNGVRRHNLARITAGGTLDPQWNPAPDGIVVDALAVDAQDRVYVAGSFERIGGAARRNLARLDGHGSGAADANWQVADAGGITRLAVASDALYVGGGFDSIAGVPRNGVARIRLDGSLDPDWAPQLDVPDITALVLDGDRLYLAGNFDAIDGAVRNGLARLSRSTGVVDAGWNPAPAQDNSEDPPYQGVSAIAVRDSLVFVGGTFRRIGGADRDNLAALSTIDGSAQPFGASGIGPVRYLERDGDGALYVLESDAHTIRKLDEHAGGALAFASPQVQVEAFVVDGDRVTLGGWFDVAPERDDVSLMQLDPDGAHAGAAWKVDGVGYVQVVQPLHDGSLIVGGNFRRVDGRPRHGIAHVRADGTLDEDFDLPADDDVSVDAVVHAVSEDAQGRIYVAGQWLRGGELGRVARLDAHGVPDDDWAPQPDGTVWSIAPDGGDVFLAGDFRRIGATWRNGLAKLGNGSGAPLDPDWNPQATWSGSAGYAFGLAVAADSLYVSGQFDRIGGEPRLGLARVQQGGIGAAMAWNPEVDGAVNAMRVHDGALLLAGTFAHVGSQSRSGLAMVGLQGDGTPLAWNPLGATPARFAAVAPAADGTLYAFGWRDVADDAVAVLRIDGGAIDPDWRVQVRDINQTLETIATGTDGRLYLGGSFDRVGDRCRLGLAAVGAAVIGDRIFADDFETCP